MKYKWSMRKFWKSWAKQDINRWIFKKIYGFNMDGFSGTMLPKTGKGKYVSVYSKNKIIQIVDEEGIYDEIRIIPYQPNHGVMVEAIDKNGNMKWRNHLDIHQLNKGIIYASNVEQLTKTKIKKD